MKTIKLTINESNFLKCISRSDFTLDGDGICDYIVIPEYEEALQMPMSKIRGVMASLVKKGVVEVTEISKQEDGYGWSWVMVNHDYTEVYATDTDISGEVFHIYSNSFKFLEFAEAEGVK